jgi:hypothetical protein
MMRVSYKNTFLSLETTTISSAKSRAKSAESRFAQPKHEMGFELHLDNLNRVLALPKVTAKQNSVTVWQSPPEAFDDVVTDMVCSKPFSKAHKNLSMMSLSTMASDDDASSRSPMRHVRSSDSVSTMWSEMEDDGEREIKQKTMPPGVWNQQAPTLTTPKESRHGNVPKSVNLAEEYAKAASTGCTTTLMIRNVPNRYSQRDLINELKSLGFAGTFDFLYVPLDLGTMSNVGYAFVNFTHHSWAEKCMETLQNHRFKRHRQAGKVAAVSVAHIQGLEANLKHYEKSAVNTSRLRQRRPVVIANMSELIE